MRLFPIPFSMSAEEKIFGGHLSLRQLAYIAISVILFCVIYFESSSLPLILRLFLFFPTMGLGLSMGFVQIYDVNLDSLLLLALKYYFRPKSVYPPS